MNRSPETSHPQPPPPPEHLAVVAAVVAALSARPGGLVIEGSRRSRWLDGRRPARVQEREGCLTNHGRRGALRRTAGDTT